MLYEDRIADLSKRLEDERRGHTNQHASWCIKVRQNVSKRLKARQMCVNANAISKTSLNNCTGHPIMHKTPNRNYSILHVYCIFKTSVFYLPTVVFIAKKEWFVPWKGIHVHE